MGDVTLSSEFLVGIILGVFVPLLWWHIKIYLLTKQTRDMHLEPDKYGFGGTEITQLLTTGLESAEERQERQVLVNKGLTRSFRELVYYVRWSAEKQCGEKPPPYIDENG